MFEVLEKLGKSLKYGIIASAWIIYIVIGIVGNLSDSKSTHNRSNTTVTEMQDVNNEKTAETPIYYKKDEVVNQFITDYQKKICW